MHLHIATVTKSPLDFDVWITYHGVHSECRLHLYYDAEEESDEGYQEVLRTLARLDAKFPGKLKCHLDLVGRHFNKDEYASLGVFTINQYRQKACVSHALKVVRDHYVRSHPGEHWMFHIDDDELISTTGSSIQEQIQSISSSGVDNVSIPNWEARISHTPTSIFDVRIFETDSSKFLAYQNGKACAQVKETTDSDGVHCFKNNNTACYGHVSDNLKILHYNCTNYEKWKQKYTLYSQRPQNESIFCFDKTSDALFRLQGGASDGFKKAYYESKLWATLPSPTQVDASPLHAYIVNNIQRNIRL